MNLETLKIFTQELSDAKTLKEIAKRNELVNFAYELKNNGFTVATPLRFPFKWIYFEKAESLYNGIGYYQLTDKRFTTIHKPSTKYGHGFASTSGEYTLANAYNALQGKHWTIDADVTYYKNLDELINSRDKKWQNLVIL